ncbi:hypothetical protein [Bacillus suaedaesalsae]|uniref:DUF4183 domain-containing protein n=1 Tax=Bacillus suaedaesalsae TaxID=2810349 RepID=A0ABS2DG17_9BACI|nr:hypothetical protein [Bacillus suaedaesalsae]MBM6616481.1 hypothetical protein [Bacillus suaedaesalsae]
MKQFSSFYGMIRSIQDFSTGGNEEMTGCYKIISVINSEGTQVNFVVSPTTYFLDHVMVQIGDMVTGFYDVNAPVPFIYPPQYQAIAMAKDTPNQNVKVDFFDSQLVSRDGQLKLNISIYTPILLPNNQAFTLNPSNRNLLVVYGPSTFSIPAQTPPYKIVVMC